MFDRERKLYEFNLVMCRRLAADITEPQLLEQPAAGIKPPIWVLGHLAVATDFARRILADEPLCPRAWHVAFAPGSRNLPPESVRPTKAELLSAIERGHRHVAEAVAHCDLARLEQPHGVALLANTPLQTLGDTLAHLMTTHEAFHLGQLSTWRRQMGSDPLF